MWWPRLRYKGLGQIWLGNTDQNLGFGTVLIQDWALNRESLTSVFVFRAARLSRRGTTDALHEWSGLILKRPWWLRSPVLTCSITSKSMHLMYCIQLQTKKNWESLCDLERAVLFPNKQTLLIKHVTEPCWGPNQVCGLSAFALKQRDPSVECLCQVLFGFVFPLEWQK